MTPHLILLLRVVVLLVCAFTFSGCVTRGYKLASKDTPPPVALNLVSSPSAVGVGAAAAPADAVLQSVIIYQGPGSWKREAYWDEYLLTFTNRTNEPVVVTGGTLHANNGDSCAPGDNPWTLERAGKQWWQSNAARQSGTYLLLGAGTVGATGVAALGALTGLWGSMSSAGAAAFGLGAATAVALPVVAGSTVYMNFRRKHQIQDEFARRRLVLPLTIAPGETKQGSLFFRITPSPRELVVHCGHADARHDARINLAPLVGLHMRMPIFPAQPESR